MSRKKNIKAGIINFNFLQITIIFFLIFSFNNVYGNNLEGSHTNIKVLDKISSKNILIKLKNGEEIKHKDLSIKSMKCKNSEFDDNPEVTAYLQVRDLTKRNKDDVFVFNGWMFSSSPSITPFDHPVYDIWLISCY